MGTVLLLGVTMVGAPSSSSSSPSSCGEDLSSALFPPFSAPRPPCPHCCHFLVVRLRKGCLLALLDLSSYSVGTVSWFLSTFASLELHNNLNTDKQKT
ncbi:hypothetical protein QL285_082361 [Trifolium repens]|nr:hypothetical protein QL285_082361 [Trifolium repens]